MSTDELSVGDEVVITRYRYGERIGTPATIERTTKTQYIAAGRRFHKKSMEEIGGRTAWHPADTLVLAASIEGQKLLAQMKRDRSFGAAAAALRKFETNRYSLEETFKAKAALERHYDELLSTFPVLGQ